MGGEELAIRELDFTASARVDTSAELRLTGSADNGIVWRFKDLIDRLHAEVVAAGARTVRVDIRELEFMNAGSFNVFIDWLGLVNDLEPAQRYRLRFFTSEKIAWQQRSLRMLTCFATDLVTVVVS